jgi:hypothetical protein
MSDPRQLGARVSVATRIIDYQALRRSYVRWRLDNSAILDWYRHWANNYWRREHAR